MINRASLVGFVALGSLFSIGCGGGEEFAPETGVMVKGVLTNNGTPVTTIDPASAYGYVEMTLFPADATSEDAVNAGSMSNTEDSGAFMFSGDGGGVKPGKYKIIVRQEDPNTFEDVFKGKFSGMDTPIEVDVPADKVGGEHDLGTIELSKFDG